MKKYSVLMYNFNDYEIMREPKEVDPECEYIYVTDNPKYQNETKVWKVIVDKEDIYKLNEANLAIFRRRQVGLIYQFYNLIPILNIEENITLPILLDGRKVDKEYLNELINILGLEKRLNHLPNELSGGEQQRVSIGRALMNRPAILLADEPTGNLDSKSSKEIVELLKLSNKKYNQTIIMITHDNSLALNADRIITIKDGRIINDERVDGHEHSE